jgi:16S rRNA (cytidine1402-2'-O)-methyltransferase
MSGKLIVIPTPIGNLGDITIRALDMLKTVDLLLCEDSRVTGKLLKHYDIKVPMRPYHAHNEHKITGPILEIISQGNTVGLVSDAGTPGVSDPGYLLIKEVIQQSLGLEILPGANAAITGLLSAGYPSDRFHFEGFLPHKKGRKTRWEYLSHLPSTVVLYESPHRISKCIDEIVEYCGPDRPVTICRELTKLYEEMIRGTAEELKNQLSERSNLKGEIVVVIGPAAVMKGKQKKEHRIEK